MKRNVRRQSISVALFPFLAVLICTLGVLIVLLVLFTHQAQVQAKTIVASQQQAAAAPALEDPKIREQIEDAAWRREMLEQQRTEKAAELADSRAKLTHLEGHLRELQDRAKELMAQARAIDEGKEPDDSQLADSRKEIDRLREEIARKQAELNEARRKHKEKEGWYALIPYDGPQGTRRRPIYLECTDRGIVLQPEGLVFRPDDFNGPMGPGNPLDAALRTVREYLQQAEGGKGGDAYPLLVVRPSGVVSYGAARSALKAWDDEFGYELISDDKKIDFGGPDPALASRLQSNVQQARQRQAAMLAAMPRKFGSEEPLRSFDPAELPNIAGTTSVVGGGPGRGVGNGRGGFGGFGDATAGGPSLGSPTGEGGGSGAGAADRYTPGGTAGNGVAVGGAADHGNTAGGGQPSYPTTASGGQPGPYGAAGQSGAPAGSGASSGSPAGPPGASQIGGIPAGSAGGQSGGSATYGATGAPSTSSGGSAAKRGPSQVKSGAGRGSNWGLPGANARSTGITRPIHIAVLLDRLVIIPEAGDDRPQQQLRVPDRLRDSDIDAFVTGVQKEMKSWGLAVEGGYWKPVLGIAVAPDAEHHFADLQKALDSSGFELRRKEP